MKKRQEKTIDKTVDRERHYQAFLKRFGIKDKVNGQIMYGLISYHLDTEKYYTAAWVHQRRKEYKQYIRSKYKRKK